MNIGYIRNSLDNELIGIVANSKEYICYYTDDGDLNDLISIIIKKNEVISTLTRKETSDNTSFIYETSKCEDKPFIRGLSYQLPFPYHISELKYIDTNPNEIYKLFLKKLEAEKK